MSPLSHSKPRRRLQDWGPSLRPLVGTCCMQNTKPCGERRQVGRRCAYSWKGNSLARRVWRKLRSRGRGMVGREAEVGLLAQAGS